MSWRVEFQPRVEEDVAEAATWYETRQPGLGAQLLDQRQRRRQLQVQRGVELVLDLKKLRGFLCRHDLGELLEIGPLKLCPLLLPAEHLFRQFGGSFVSHVLIGASELTEQLETFIKQLVQLAAVVVVSRPELDRFVVGELNVLSDDQRLLCLEIRAGEFDERAQVARVHGRLRRAGYLGGLSGSRCAPAEAENQNGEGEGEFNIAVAHKVIGSWVTWFGLAG